MWMKISLPVCDFYYTLYGMNERVLPVVGIRLNAVMKNVYLWMCLALGISGLVSLYISSNEAIIRAITTNPLLLIVLIIAQLGIVLMLSARIHVMSIRAAVLSFGAYAILTGITLSPIFLIYTKTSIASTFFITAGTFGALSIWALTTKRMLHSWGRYLFFALIGILIASLVNIFLRSQGLYWLISIIGVVLFMGLTAYDTQRIRNWCEALGDNPNEADYMRLSILGALKLYLDFINLFLFMLRFLGRRN